MTDRRGTMLVATALIVTWLAGWVLLSKSETTSVPEDSSSETTIVAEPIEAPIPFVVHVETPVPQVEGLTDTVSRVLAARGFADTMDPGELVGELPESIVRLLIDRGVALSVADESTP